MCSAIGDRSPSGLSIVARPRLIPEGEDERHNAWPATDRKKGWPHSRDDAPIGARPGTRCAIASGIRVMKIGEVWTRRRVNFGGGPCPRSETRTS